MDQKNEMKVIFVGDGGVGKSCIVSGFNKHYLPTMGAEVHPKEYNTIVGKVTLKCWDCSGQNKFQGMGDGYYRNADIAVVVFSVDSRISFRNVQLWITKVKNQCENIPIILCGNKADIADRKIESEEVMRKQDELGFDYYMETSAKHNEGVRQLYMKILREYVLEEGEDEDEGEEDTEDEYDSEYDSDTSVEGYQR